MLLQLARQISWSQRTQERSKMAFTHEAGWRPPSSAPEYDGVLKSTGAGGTYGALAVRFSGPDERDLQQEFFSAETDFGPLGGAGSVPTLFNHGSPISKDPIAKAFADAVFLDAQITRT